MRKFILSSLIILVAHAVCFAQTDTLVGIEAPKDMCRDYKDLAHYLCDDLQGEKAKANAIYNWITHNIKYDVKAISKGVIKQPKIDKVLKDRKGVCGGYSLLFTEMCREAGLKAMTIDGYAKDWMFDNGDKVYIPRHAWSAVMINGNWELADPTWGAGGLVPANNKLRSFLNKIFKGKLGYPKHYVFKFNYKPNYFMQDPELYKLKHLPTDPLWQLSDTIMPVTYFESGDSAVKKWNELSKPWKNNPELLRVCSLSEDQREFELAERAYRYNTHFPVAMAIKNIYAATAVVEKAFTDSTVQNPDLLVAEAKNTLKKGQEYIKEQKKSIPEQYSNLKKKNRTKNQDAKQYIRQIKTDDKRLVSASKKYIKSSGRKNGKIAKKAGQASKRRHGVYPQKVDEIEPAKMQKDKNSPEVIGYQDSITSRKRQLAVLNPTIAAQKAKIKSLEDKNSILLDTLASRLVESDSLLVSETMLRIQLHDNMDDDVITLSRQFKDVKYNKADTLHKYYMAGYDSIVAGYDLLQKLENQQMDIHKKSVRTLEQFKKWNASNSDVDEMYKQWAGDYLLCIDTFNLDLASYSGFLKKNKKVFGAIAKASNHQIKVTDYMSKAEELRSKMEKREIAGRQAFDKRENEKQTAAVKKIEKKVQQIANKMK